MVARIDASSLARIARGGQALACALALALAADGCGGRAAEPGPHRGGTLHWALRDSFSTLDPAFAWDPELTPFLHLIYEGLVAFDDSGLVRPAAAARWSVSPDGRRLRFELRSNLRYASGEPVRAADFKRGIERLFRPGALRSPGAPQFAAVEGALRAGVRGAPPLGVEAPDDSTLVLRLAWPDPFLLEKLAQPRYAIPVSARADSADVLASTGSRARGGARFDTSGPYAFESAGKNAVRFVRNPYFAAAHAPPAGATRAETRALAAQAGWPDTIHVLTAVPGRRALLGLESGRLDVLCPMPPEFRERLARSRRFERASGELSPALLWYLAFNAELAPLARRDARRAMVRGINRQRLSEELGSLVLPWRQFTDEQGGATAPGYDPDEAKTSLEAAGYFAGMRVPVVAPRGTAGALACDALAPAAARASIQFDLQPVPRSAWVHAALDRRGALAVWLPWSAPSSDGVDGLASLLLNRGLGSGWGGNWAWYHPSSGLDSLLVRGLREADPVARRAVRDQVAEVLESEVPLVPLARVRIEAVYRPEWGGVRIHPRYGFDPAACWRRDTTSPLTTNR